MIVLDVENIVDIPCVVDIADEDFFFDCFTFDDNTRTYSNGCYSISFVDDEVNPIFDSITIREIIGDYEPIYFSLSINTESEALKMWHYRPLNNNLN
jgi:hypothetical protein